MKKTVLLLLPALTLPTAVEANWFGKYKSQVEAKEACIKWADKGFKYSYEIKEWIIYRQEYGELTIREQTSRYCEYEGSTRQYLGYERIGAKKGELIKESDFLKIFTKIKKYFKY